MLETLFNPRSICLIGASADDTKLAGKPLVRLTQHRYPHDVYLVNPKYESIGGRRCYGSVIEIGQPIDVALVALRAPQVPGVIRECGQVGVKFAIVIGSGFGEEATAKDLAAELVTAVEESGVRLVGPNCEGVWSTPANMALTFGSAADRPSLLPGLVSVVSQSGSIGGALLRRLQDDGIGCRYFVSSGNEADLTAMDYLDYLVEEGGTGVIALFLEAIRDGHRLRAIARRATSKGMRMVALCAGASELGRVATFSHTGRIASAGAIYRDLLSSCGILMVNTFTQLVSAAEAAVSRQLLVTRSGHSAASGVGIVAISGGSRGLLADSCARLDVPLATYAHETEVGLDALLPRFGFSKNPTDLTGEVLADLRLFSEVLRTAVKDPYTEALIVQYANGAERELARQLALFRDLVSRADMPIIVSLLGKAHGDIMTRLRSVGVLCVADPHEAVECLSWLYRWRDVAEREGGAPAPRRRGQTLGIDSWQERMELLGRAGIAVPHWRLWRGSVEDLHGLRFPLALKALPKTSEHKTEDGLVFLGLRDVADLKRAFATFRSRVPAGTPALVQEMASASVEVLVAVRQDPDFGPVLAIGSGGLHAEWLRDLTHLPLPTTESEILNSLQRLRIWELLQPFRGRRASDVRALVEASRRLGDLYISHVPTGFEVEINPLLVGQTGEGVVAVDVLCTHAAGTPDTYEPAVS